MFSNKNIKLNKKIWKKLLKIILEKIPENKNSHFTFINDFNENVIEEIKIWKHIK